jgi:hypothetical protein
VAADPAALLPATEPYRAIQAERAREAAAPTDRGPVEVA